MLSHVDAVQPDRIIRLVGGQNFREIGGYPTMGGRQLRRGLLWRSAKLDELTADDVRVIRSLGIATIGDLRRRSEREQSPTHEALLTGARVLAWDVSLAREEGYDGLYRQDGSDEDYLEAVLALYRVLAEEHRLHLRELYEAIADGATPVLIHCAAGKDRTGVAVGLLLELLGVERPYVIADYAKTEQLLDWNRLKKNAAAGAGVSQGWIDRLSPAALQLIMRSDPRYLTAAFEAMEVRYGSTRNFAIQALGLTAATLERLHEQLLEDA
ncbi:tyrosine-protein phosphatase [Novosphingobium sp. HII-3]|uniref:tyrosine-protein phosphatase n=1 Tax=Novosphingobium sp. HII-3 TaxID=2075565 RepID=UPI000CDA199E|nr:tyrosine-protein phosphatase [Novosphingobium sp. HII-3]